MESSEQDFKFFRTSFEILPAGFWNSSGRVLEFFRLKFCSILGRRFVWFFNKAAPDSGAPTFADLKICRPTFEILPDQISNSSEQLLRFFRRHFWILPAAPFGASMSCLSGKVASIAHSQPTPDFPMQKTNAPRSIPGDRRSRGPRLTLNSDDVPHQNF